jgi:hypothetical protein
LFESNRQFRLIPEKIEIASNEIFLPFALSNKTFRAGPPTADNLGIVVCEAPAKPQWCAIRTTVFSWDSDAIPVPH